MQEGFVMDMNYGSRLVSRWVEGPPKRSIWAGTQIDGRNQYKIKAFRCLVCGFLESYAPEE